MGFPFCKLKHSHKKYLQWDPVHGVKVTFILDWFVLGVSASLHLHIAQRSNSTTSVQPPFWQLSSKYLIKLWVDLQMISMWTLSLLESLRPAQCTKLCYDKISSSNFLWYPVSTNTVSTCALFWIWSKTGKTTFLHWFCKLECAVLWWS